MTFFVFHITLLQAAPAAGLDLLALLDKLIDLWNGHLYVVAVAVIVGALVALAKSGHVGDFLQNKIPPKWRPVFALAISEIAMVSTEIQAGKTWQAAVFDGFMAAAMAVFTHQVVIQGAMKGKEIIPPKADPPSGGGRLTDVKSPGPIAIGTISKPPPPTNI